MRKYYSEKAIRNWAKNSKWLRLEVLLAAGENVHFKAYFEENGILKVHEEYSSFTFEDGSWYYLDCK